MNYQILATLITEMTGDDKTIADVLNTPSIVARNESFQTTRSLINNIGLDNAETFLSSLEAAAEVIPSLARVISLLNPSEGGIDVGAIETVNQLNNLVNAGLLDETITNSIISLGEILLTPAQNAGLPKVTEGDVKFTRNL